RGAGGRGRDRHRPDPGGAPPRRGAAGDGVGPGLDRRRPGERCAALPRRRDRRGRGRGRDRGRRAARAAAPVGPDPFGPARVDPDPVGPECVGREARRAGSPTRRAAVTALGALRGAIGHRAAGRAAGSRYDRVAQRSADCVIAGYSTSFGWASRLLEEPVRTHVRSIYALVRIADETVDDPDPALPAEERSRLLEELAAETARA